MCGDGGGGKLGCVWELGLEGTGGRGGLWGLGDGRALGFRGIRTRGRLWLHIALRGSEYKEG